MSPCKTFFKIFYYILLSFFGCLCGVFRRKKKPDFSCDIVLITGAAQGLGKELAIQFSKCGATLVLWDINETKLHQTCSEITSQGKDAFAYVVDCSDKKQIYETADKVREEIGNVSVLVNNAGILPGKLITELEDAQFEKTMDVNFTSHYWTIRAFLPWMLENDYGHIVEMSSVSAYTGGCFTIDYCASKAAIVNFAQSLRYDLLFMRKTGISVTCVCPWNVTNTGLIKDSRVAMMTDQLGKSRLTPEYVAKHVVQSVTEKKSLVVLPGIFKLALFINFLIPSKVLGNMLGELFDVKSLIEQDSDDKVKQE